MNETIITRIQKLLRLAGSDNIAEATLAGQKAQELMTKHKISSGEIASQSEEDSIDMDKGQFHPQYYEKWDGILVLGLAKINNVWATRERNSLTLYGTQLDRELVEYLYTYFSREIRKMAKKEFFNLQLSTLLEESWERDTSQPSFANWKLHFGLGASRAILSGMRAAKEAVVAACNSNALVVLDRKLARYLQDQGISGRGVPLRVRGLNDIANSAGQAAGQQMHATVGVNAATPAKALR